MSQQPHLEMPHYQLPQNAAYNAHNPHQIPPQVNINLDGLMQKRVSKIAYILLALFLGGLGIHKFYAGKAGMGILYLLFCWTFIPGFIAFIEAIVAIFRPADMYGRIAV